MNVSGRSDDPDISEAGCEWCRRCEDWHLPEEHVTDVSTAADDPDMTPHALIENLITAKAGNPNEYRDYLNTATVALAHRPDLEPLAQVLDQLIDEAAFARHKGVHRTDWTYTREHGWIDA